MAPKVARESIEKFRAMSLKYLGIFRSALFIEQCINHDLDCVRYSLRCALQGSIATLVLRCSV